MRNLFCVQTMKLAQRFVKGEVFCFRYPYFHFQHGKSTSTASQLSTDLNKVPLLLQNLELATVPLSRFCKRKGTLLKSLLNWLAVEFFWLAVESLSQCQK